MSGVPNLWGPSAPRWQRRRSGRGLSISPFSETSPGVTLPPLKAQMIQHLAQGVLVSFGGGPRVPAHLQRRDDGHLLRPTVVEPVQTWWSRELESSLAHSPYNAPVFNALRFPGAPEANR